MPEKKKKAKKAKKGSIADVSILKKFFKTYESHCTKEKSAVSPTIKKGLRRCIDNEVNITKFVLANPEISLEDVPPVFLNPLLMAIRDERYLLGKELYVWDIHLRNQDIANLAILLALHGRTIYPFSKLELLDCGVDTWSLDRLGKVINFSNLVSIVLDYNEFGEDGLRCLVHGLQGNKKLISLSLCYCNLGPPAGAILGPVLAETAIQEIYLNGNYLQCLGALELITPIAVYAQKLGSERQASTQESRKDIAHQILEADHSSGVNTAISEVDNSVPDPPPPGKPDSIARRRKKKKGIKKKIKEPVEPGAWITKLHLADNGIDGRGEEGEIGVLGFIQILSLGHSWHYACDMGESGAENFKMAPNGTPSDDAVSSLDSGTRGGAASREKERDGGEGGEEERAEEEGREERPKEGNTGAETGGTRNVAERHGEDGPGVPKERPTTHFAPVSGGPPRHQDTEIPTATVQGGRSSSLIMYSDTLKELDLDDNSIGDLPAQDILEALIERKQGNLDSLKIKVTAQMSPDTFHAIFKHGKKLKSTKRRKKKKAKK